MIILILFLINISLMFVNVYDLYINKYKRHTYALILSKNHETIGRVKVDTSDKKFKYKDGTYIMSFKPFIKIKNYRLILYEKGNPEPLDVFENDFRRLNSDVLDTILDMEKIRALNKPSSNIFGNIDKKYIFIGIAVIIAVLLFTGVL